MKEKTLKEDFNHSLSRPTEEPEEAPSLMFSGVAESGSALCECGHDEKRHLDCGYCSCKKFKSKGEK